jgi:hypothetical protein
VGRRLTTGQRVIAIIGFAVVLLTIGRFVEREAAPNGGWFGYAPQTELEFYPPTGLRPWVSALLWIG